MGLLKKRKKHIFDKKNFSKKFNAFRWSQINLIRIVCDFRYNLKIQYGLVKHAVGNLNHPYKYHVMPFSSKKTHF